MLLSPPVLCSCLQREHNSSDRGGSGLLAPFPLFVNVTVAFAHRHHGVQASIMVLRVAMALFAFAVFFLVVGGLLPRFSIGWTYAIGGALAVSVNGFSLRGIHANVEVD